jgi:hypothetical protein
MPQRNSAADIPLRTFRMGGSGNLTSGCGKSLRNIQLDQNNMERKRKALVALMLLDEIEDDYDILPLLVRTHEDRNVIYKNRQTEGCYDILIRRHLLDNETKFKRFFRVSRDQFFYLVNLIESDFKINPSNRDPRPLTAEMKLAVTLRYVYVYTIIIILLNHYIRLIIVIQYSGNFYRIMVW